MSDTAEQTEKNWSIAYPVYIDAAYPQSKGRRIGRPFCVENPTAAEMTSVMNALGLPCACETDKRHPASPRLQGRVRFLLRNDEGELYNPDIDSKSALWLAVAEKIPQLKSRQLAQEALLKKQQEADKNAAKKSAGGKSQRRR